MPQKPIPAEAGQMPHEVATAMSAVVDAIRHCGKSTDRQVQANLSRAREHLAEAMAAQVVDPALAVDHAQKASRFAALATGQPVPPTLESPPPPPAPVTVPVPDRLDDLELTPAVTVTVQRSGAGVDVAKLVTRRMVARHLDERHEAVLDSTEDAASEALRDQQASPALAPLAEAVASGVAEGLRRAVPLLPGWARAELALFADPPDKASPPPPEPKSRAPRPRGETRDRVTELLKGGPRRVAPLATALGITQGAIIPTLRKMAACGQIESYRDGKGRWYRLPPTS